MRTRAMSNRAHQVATTHNQAMAKISLLMKTNNKNQDASYVVAIFQTEKITRILNKVVHNKATQTTHNFNKDQTTNNKVNHAATAVAAPAIQVVHVKTAVDQDVVLAVSTTKINSVIINNKTADNNNNNNSNVDHHSDNTDHVNHKTLIKWASTQINNNSNNNQADA